MIILSQKKIKHSIMIKILHGISKRKSVIKEVIIYNYPIVSQSKREKIAIH